MPNPEKFTFKDAFIDRYSKLTDFGAFKRYSLSFLRKSIRVNTTKITVEEVRKRLEKTWILEPIPWCREGFWIEHRGTEIEGKIHKRRDIGNLREHALGYFYVQEAASMIPPIVLDPKPGEKILDMCASPGSKTTQMGQMMENKGIVVANDISADRLAALGVNIQRCGLVNAVITKSMGYNIREGGFDRILVDAPCSGTGTIRKSLKTLEMWNPNLGKKLASQQRKLLQHAFTLLKEGGTLVYSTCTMEPDEDEGVIDWFLKQNKDAKLEEIKLDIKRSDAVLEFDGEKYNPEIKKCLRLWPQDNDTEGFFVTKIRKI
ncbi:tRNA methyltransferase [Candidatus Woesearchaeota archaeon CG10_big_fil_rev_8_21_14_0_10_44_13]|nr:MAG: tRNA methyltransferase [Candidatus Woesearchaeota archaeon CG10_big_fil_rev_8_21_14_0_10_44_13]